MDLFDKTFPETNHNVHDINVSHDKINLSQQNDTKKKDDDTITKIIEEINNNCIKNDYNSGYTPISNYNTKSTMKICNDDVTTDIDQGNYDNKNNNDDGVDKEQNNDEDKDVDNSYFSVEKCINILHTIKYTLLTGLLISIITSEYMICLFNKYAVPTNISCYCSPYIFRFIVGAMIFQIICKFI